MICRHLILYVVICNTLKLKNFNNTLVKLSSWNPINWDKLTKNRLDAINSTHPLRHSTWNIEIHANGVELPNKLNIKFHKNGKITSSDPNITGYWKSGPYGIIFSLNYNNNKTYHFSGELCWNNYGDSAFFRKGVIYSDRNGFYKFLFRPIHGKFNGKSIKNT